MRSLLLFFFRYRAFITFIVLEVLSGILIVQNTHYQKALFFNSSNSAIGGILDISNNVSSFISLGSVNEELASENALLKQQLVQAGIQQASQTLDDSLYQFYYRTAEVINNSVSLRNNTLTIRIGSSEGVKEGMGVIGGGGVVGKVRYVSDNYSIVTSLLHTDGLLSAQVKDKVGLCTIGWDAVSHEKVNLLYVPRQYHIEVGDSVLTSGVNAVFPNGLFIGTVSDVDLTEEATFYEAKVRLGNDFINLSHVDVIENRYKNELDSLAIEVSDE